MHKQKPVLRHLSHVSRDIITVDGILKTEPQYDYWAFYNLSPATVILPQESPSKPGSTNCGQQT